MMKEQQDKLRQEYEGRLADLERERETIEEEKAQVDRYKQLLLKQRDIMIALTQRLVERDEQIMALQDELDAYDKHYKELEEKLDEKTALYYKFRRISMEVMCFCSGGYHNHVNIVMVFAPQVNARSPQKNDELSRELADWGTDDMPPPLPPGPELGKTAYIIMTTTKMIMMMMNMVFFTLMMMNMLVIMAMVLMQLLGAMISMMASCYHDLRSLCRGTLVVKAQAPAAVRRLDLQRLRSNWSCTKQYVDILTMMIIMMTIMRLVMMLIVTMLMIMIAVIMRCCCL